MGATLEPRPGVFMFARPRTFDARSKTRYFSKPTGIKQN
jgi:hypothetical protein